MIGSIFISLGFAAALISMVSYALITRGSKLSLLPVARTGFHVAVVSTVAASVVLMYLIVTHQFQYHYIWAHSSKNLSTGLLMASFYAGQEGSFMLWALLTAFMGIAVYSYSRRVRYEPPTMAVYMMVFTALLLILVFKSPFLTIYQVFTDPNNLVPAGFIPPDGKGLNPTLENIWITIHPPILFLGFASMTVPFVFAVAGLIRKDYQRWINLSLPWTLFASMTLGFGIMLGGWWAYETLGWGGFWGWDPVENSSLIPWLVCVALVHTMLVQKRTGEASVARGGSNVGGLVKTNFALSVFAFGTVLYSTFLTRSGILGDTSVHSFVDPGGFVYAVLLGVLVLFLAFGFGMIAFRWRELQQAAMSMKILSREQALGLGSAVLMASAIVVLIGTSAPIFLPLLNKPKVAVPVDYYNSIHLPIAMLIVLLNGIAMTLNWKNTTPREFLRKITVALGISAVGTVGLVFLQIHDPIYIALAFGSILALVVNVQLGIKVLRGNPRYLGAYVSHAGISLMMLGIVYTARYSVTQHVNVRQGETVSAFDYRITYKGPEQRDLQRTDIEKYAHIVEVSRNGSTWRAEPIIFWSDFNNREGAFFEPGIVYTPTKDIYVSPKGLEQSGGYPKLTMKKGDRQPVPYDSSIAVRFEKFDMTRAATDNMQGSVIEVTTKDSTFYLTAYRSIDNGRYTGVGIPGTDITVGMAGINNDAEQLANSETILEFKSASHKPLPQVPMLALEVSIKPFISFVWIGVITMVGGFIFAIVRRRKEVDRMLGTFPGATKRATKPAQVLEGADEKPVQVRRGRRTSDVA